MSEHPQAHVHLDFSEWPSLWVQVSVNIANAPYRAFLEQTFELCVRVATGSLSVMEAADALQAAADYNQLPFHYGADRLQAIMSEAFKAASRKDVA